MNNTIERRVFAADMTLRAAPRGSKSPGVLTGYAAKFMSYSQDLGGFKERIKPGAFTRALKEGQDIRCLMNHDPNHILGRTKSGTLSLTQDSLGLRFSCTLPDTQLGRDLHTSVSRGDISQCSFAFKVPDGGDTWGEDTDENGNKFACRLLTDVNVFDVSAVCYPAYLDTNVSANAIDPEDEDEGESEFNCVKVSPRALVEARRRGGHAPAAPAKRELMTELERAELRGKRFAAEDHAAYLQEVAESNRPRTIDPFLDAIRKEQARANRK
jgi:HK97 family phage prohead protease